MIRAAGPKGMTTKDDNAAALGAMVHPRCYDLARQRLIFDSLLRGGPSGRAVIWVAAEFKDHYPDAWAQSQAALDAASNV